MNRFLVMVLLALPAIAQTTLVQDTIKNFDNTNANGTVFVRLTTPCTAPGGQFVATTGRPFPVANGAVSIPLIPNDTCTPAGTSYEVTYALVGGSQPQRLERWVIPTSASPVKISAVRVSTTPIPSVSVSISQLTGCSLTGGAVVYNGSSFVCQIVVTNPLSAVGDTIYGGTAGALTRLPGNITTTRRFLTQSGDGTNSAAPGWGSITAGDLPAISPSGAAGNGLSGTYPNPNIANMATFGRIPYVSATGVLSETTMSWVSGSSTRLDVTGGLTFTTMLSSGSPTAFNPGFKASGTKWLSRLADDSGYTQITAAPAAAVDDVTTRGATWNSGNCVELEPSTGKLRTTSGACLVTSGGGASISNYGQNFTAQTSVTLTHNLGSLNAIVRCTSGSVQISPNLITITDANNIAVTFSPAQTGRCTVNATSSNYNQAFTAQTAVTLTHALGSSNVAFACYNGSNQQFDPNTFTITDSNNAAVTFSPAQTGRCVVSGASGSTSNFSQSFTAQTSVAVVHSRATSDVIAECYNGSDALLLPNTLTITDTNTVTVAFSPAQTGRCVVNSASGVTAPSGSGISSLNSLTGTTQTFANDTNVTISSASTTHTLGWTGTLAASRGGTALSAIGTANQVLGVNNAAGALEYKTITAGSNVTVTHTANSITIAATGSAGAVLGGANLTTVNSIPWVSSSGTLNQTAGLTWSGTQFSVPGNFVVDPTGSTTGSPRIFGSSAFTLGQAFRFQMGDANNAIQTNYNGQLSMQSYWGIVIGGTRQGSTIGFISGASTDPSLSVQGATVGNPVLVAQGAASQTGSLQEWWNSGGSVLASVSAAGNFTGGTYNKVTITAPASGSTLTIANGKTLTVSNSITLAGTDATVMTFPSTSATVLSTAAAVTAAQGGTGLTSIGTANQVLGVNNAAGALEYKTITAGTNVTVTHSAGAITIASTAGGGTVTSIATTSPITGGTITSTGTIGCATCGVTGTGLGQFAATTSSSLAGVISDETGSGALVFATSPTLVTPVLGVAAATTINKVTLTAPATGSTLTILDGKTLTVNNSITLAGTDATVMTFPGTSATILSTAAAVTIGQGGTGQTTKAAAFDALSPMTTAGDIIYGGTSGTGTRLGIGAATTVLHGGASAPSYSQIVNADITNSTIDLTAKVTGLLPAANVSFSVLDESAGACQAAGASGTTYTCSLSPAISSYVTGGHYRFKADVANTGIPTINLNAVGAKTIKKATGGITTDLVANDMVAGQWVDLVYDGTNMQIQSTLGNAASGGGSPGGSGTELQYRGGSSTFSALANSSVPNAGELLLGTTPAASASRAVLSVGNYGSAIAGSANGQFLAIASASAFNGNHIYTEHNGTTAFSVSRAGVVLSAGAVTANSGSASLSASGIVVASSGGVVDFRNSSSSANSASRMTGSAGTASTNFLALRNSSGGTATDQLRINGDQKNVNIGQTASTTSLASLSLGVFDATATTGVTRQIVQNGQGQSTQAPWELRDYNATLGSGTLLASFSSAGDVIPRRVLMSGTAPTIGSGFGTSPSIAGKDGAGRITVGTGGSATTGVVTFNASWATAPLCVANNETTLLAIQATATTTNLTLTSATAFGAADKLVYVCVGY